MNRAPSELAPLKPSGASFTMAEQSYTVDELAEAERLSRSMLYKLWSQGKGPRFYYVGTVRRISHDAQN